jgi:hypothetical protein
LGEEPGDPIENVLEGHTVVVLDGWRGLGAVAVGGRQGGRSSDGWSAWKSARCLVEEENVSTYCAVTGSADVRLAMIDEMIGFTDADGTIEVRALDSMPDVMLAKAEL